MRRLDSLGPFGVGNPRPSFVSAGVRLLGRPSVDHRGLDLRLRLGQNGIVMPARLLRGGDRCEDLQDSKGTFRIVYSPRLGRWSDEGPVELHVSALERDGG